MPRIPGGYQTIVRGIMAELTSNTERPGIGDPPLYGLKGEPYNRIAEAVYRGLLTHLTACSLADLHKLKKEEP